MRQNPPITRPAWNTSVPISINLPLCSVFCCFANLIAFVIRPLLCLTSWILLYNFEGVWLSSKATRGVSWLSYERRPAYTHWLSHAFRGCLRNCLQLRSKPIIHSNIAKGTRGLTCECVGKENRRDICIGWASNHCLSTSFWQRLQVDLLQKLPLSSTLF